MDHQQINFVVVDTDNQNFSVRLALDSEKARELLATCTVIGGTITLLTVEDVGALRARVLGDFSNKQLEALNRYTADLELPTNAQKALKRANLLRIWQVVEAEAEDLLGKNGTFSRKTLGFVRETLGDLGLDFGQKARLDPVRDLLLP